MEVQVRREDYAALNKQSFGSDAIQFPDMRNVMHICARPRALWFWYGRREYRRKELPDVFMQRATRTT